MEPKGPISKKMGPEMDPMLEPNLQNIGKTYHSRSLIDGPGNDPFPRFHFNRFRSHLSPLLACFWPSFWPPRAPSTAKNRPEHAKTQLVNDCPHTSFFNTPDRNTSQVTERRDQKMGGGGASASGRLQLNPPPPSQRGSTACWIRRGR